MADKVGDEFEGYVTGVAAFGLFIELIEHFVEGMVHISTMADDYYRFVEGAHLLRGENTQKVYRLGDKVKVQVIRVNMEVRQIDLGLVEILERVREGERGPRRSRATPKAGSTTRQAASRTPRTAEVKRREGRSRAVQAGGFGLSFSFIPSLKFLMALPMPRPRPGRRLAPKITNDDQEDDDQFGQSKASHGATPPANLELEIGLGLYHCSSGALRRLLAWLSRCFGGSRLP